MEEQTNLPVSSPGDLTEISVVDKYELTNREQGDFFNTLLSSGVSLDVLEKNQWRSRKYVFSPSANALEARKHDDPRGQLVSSITIREAIVNNVANDPNRFMLITRNKQYLCRVTTPRLRRQWMCWIEMMCMESSVLAAHIEQAEPNPKHRPRWWVPHEEADKCAACSQGFTVTNWRHTCRQCGFIFCGRGCFIEAYKCCAACQPRAQINATPSTYLATPNTSRRPSLSTTRSPIASTSPSTPNTPKFAPTTPSLSATTPKTNTPTLPPTATATDSPADSPMDPPTQTRTLRDLSPSATPLSTFDSADLDALPPLSPPQTPMHEYTSESHSLSSPRQDASSPVAAATRQAQEDAASRNSPSTSPGAGIFPVKPVPSASSVPKPSAGVSEDSGFTRAFSPDTLTSEFSSSPANIIPVLSPAELLATLSQTRGDSVETASTASATAPATASGAARRVLLQNMRAREGLVDTWWFCVLGASIVVWYLHSVIL